MRPSLVVIEVAFAAKPKKRVSWEEKMLPRFFGSINWRFIDGVNVLSQYF